MKVKRFIATFLAVALVFAMAACSATADNSTSSKPSSNTTSEAPKESTSVASKDDDSSTKDEATTPAEDEDTTAPKEDSSETEEKPSGPPKSIKDNLSEEDTQNLKDSIAKSVIINYCEPHNIDVADFTWSDFFTDSSVYNYYIARMDDFQSTLMGGEEEPTPADTEASDYSEMGEAIFTGVVNWLDGQYYNAGYINSINRVIYPVEEFISSIDLTAVEIDPEASPEPDAK